MASRVYTAQEMRDKATELQESADEISRDAVEEGGCTYKPLCKADAREIETIANMLRQAAEMHERAEELKAQCLKICGRETCDHKGDKCVCCARDVIDFIVRGDEETATGFTVGRMPFVSGDTSRRCE